jgi:hypothetical protein
MTLGSLVVSCPRCSRSVQVDVSAGPLHRVRDHAEVDLVALAHEHHCPQAA